MTLREPKRRCHSTLAGQRQAVLYASVHPWEWDVAEQSEGALAVRVAAPAWLWAFESESAEPALLSSVRLLRVHFPGRRAGELLERSVLADRRQPDWKRVAAALAAGVSQWESSGSQAVDLSERAALVRTWLGRSAAVWYLTETAAPLPRANGPFSVRPAPIALQSLWASRLILRLCSCPALLLLCVHSAF